MLDLDNKPSTATPDSECQHCRLTNICSHLPLETSCQPVSGAIVETRQPLSRKELLYSYHDRFKCLYAVKSGTLKTFHIDMNGQEHIQNFYFPGEIIGFEAIETGYYPYAAMALTPSIVCEIPYDHLLAVIANHADLQKYFITSLAERINQGEYKTAPSAEQRLAAFLLDIARRLHQHGTSQMELPMSRYDIGNYLSLAPETISRLFTRFQQSKLLRAQNKKVTLLDTVSLQWIAQDGINKQ